MIFKFVSLFLGPLDVSLLLVSELKTVLKNGLEIVSNTIRYSAYTYDTVAIGFVFYKLREIVLNWKFYLITKT